MTKIEQKILDRLYSWRYPLFLFIITLLALIIRFLFLPIRSGDFNGFLIHWFNTLKENGGFLAIKNPIGDYNIPYLTILAGLTYLPISPLISIKMVSILFEFIGALFASLIVKKLTKSHHYSNLFSILAYTITLFLPTVVLNGAAWAQCDFIYTSFILISFYLLLHTKYSWAFLSYGIALSFKLQAIFVLPILIIIYLVNRKFSILNFLLIPLSNLVLSLPALLLGYPFKKFLLIYFNQTETYHDLTMNFPNVYNLINNHYDQLKLPGIIFTLVVVGIFTMTIWCKKIKISNQQIISYSLWLIMAITFFLPGMHDRYLFSADILSIIYFMIYRKNIYLPIFINLASLSTYIIYLFGMPTSNILFLSYGYLIVLSIFTYQIFNNIFTSQYEELDCK